MTFKELQDKIAQPPYSKIARYLPSFWSLTKDEQARVRAKHYAIDNYMTLHEKLMYQGVQELMKAVSAGYSDTVLKVESLEDTLRHVTFP